MGVPDSHAGIPVFELFAFLLVFFPSIRVDPDKVETVMFRLSYSILLQNLITKKIQFLDCLHILVFIKILVLFK